MAEYDLPDGPRQLFEAVHKPLAEHLGGESRFRLGGGTALAMRWAHRHSTDVDLFTDRAPYARLYERRASLERDLGLRGIPLNAARIRPRNLKILLQDSEVTLFSGGPMLPGLPPSGDTIRGTHVELEGNAEILAKKLAGRMLDTPRQLLERDLYDVAVADRLDPEAAKTAMRAIDRSDLRQLHTELKNLSQGWGGRAKQRRIIQPVYREEAADPARFAAAVVWREILSRTPPRPHRPPPAWER